MQQTMPICKATNLLCGEGLGMCEYQTFHVDYMPDLPPLKKVYEYLDSIPILTCMPVPISEGAGVVAVLDIYFLC